jgi:O-antigen/teichoic acid export membrane protein
VKAENKKFAFNALLCSFGRVLTGVFTLLMMPLYLPLLGAEAFGLFGVFIIVSLIFGVLEGGLGNLIIKDFAVLGARKQSIYPLLRSFEFSYLIFGALQTIAAIILIEIGTFSFLKADQLTQTQINECLYIISFSFLVGGPSVIYDALITARNQIVALNVTRLIYSVISSVGAYVVLRISDGDPRSFFIWWVVASLIISCIKASICWKGECKYFLQLKPKLNVLKPYLGAQVKLMMNSALTFASNHYIFWCVGLLFPLSILGLYTLGTRIASTIASGLAALIRPLISRYAYDQEKSGSGSRILVIMTQVIIIFGAVIYSGYYLNHEWLISLWMNNKEFSANEISKVSLILLSVGLINVGVRPMVSALQADRKFKLLYQWYSLGAILGFSLCFIVGKHYGFQQMLITNLLVNGTVLIFIYPKMLTELDSGALAKRQIIKTLTYAVAGAIIMISGFQYIEDKGNILFLMVTGVCCILLLGGLLFNLKSRLQIPS